MGMSRKFHLLQKLPVSKCNVQIQILIRRIDSIPAKNHQLLNLLFHIRQLLVLHKAELSHSGFLKKFLVDLNVGFLIRSKQTITITVIPPVFSVTGAALKYTFVSHRFQSGLDNRLGTAQPETAHWSDDTAAPFPHPLPHPQCHIAVRTAPTEV